MSDILYLSLLSITYHELTALCGGLFILYKGKKTKCKKCLTWLFNDDIIRAKVKVDEQRRER